ncbi:MAG: histidine ammonia-lyase [Myxococcota bacterium]
MGEQTSGGASGETPTRVVVGDALTLEDVAAVAIHGSPAVLGERGRSALEGARRAVEDLLVEGAGATYGINTGFGALAEVRIPPHDLAELQHRLLRSHAVGVGEALGRESTRAMMLLRAHVLALGYSGVRPRVVELLLAMLNAGVHPVIPSKGSVGASGDLAPLAHLALVLIGEGEAEVEGEVLPGDEALRRAGLEPLWLGAKEGLALINGTQGMLAVGSLALVRATRLVRSADVTGAMTLEAMKGSVRPFDEEVVAARPHPGALASAAHLRSLLTDSAIVASHEGCGEVQDAYSLRCMPQVHGSARDVLGFARQVLSVELNAATDNPLVLRDGRIQSGGNFHGQPVAAALDAATAAVADLASISERRIAQVVDPALNRGLPPFLAEESGLNSGFMMAQVTAASLVSEARALSVPKSADSIPTSADREDHVSMGMTAARHFAVVVEHLEHVLAIEAVVAGEGIRQRGLRPGRGVAAAAAKLGEVVQPVHEDRPFHRDFAAARGLLRSGALLAATAGGDHSTQ